MDIARETALKILYDITENGAYSNISLNKHFKQQDNLKNIDKAFISELTFGTIRWKLKIDYIIEQFSSIRLKKISPWIINILRLGVYQILFMEKVPIPAACNESVKLCKKYGHHASSGFVNAVLRNIARNKENLKYPDMSDYTYYLSVIYSHPEWLVKRWLEHYGKDFTEKLLDSNNNTPELSIKINTLKASKKEVSEMLTQQGFTITDGKYIKDALIINNAASLLETETYKKGYFQVQDESSMLATEILEPKPGELVIDVCSAPGGKSLNIATLMKNTGALISRDIHPHKIKLIEEAINKMGFTNVKTELFDALELDTTLIGKADRVLADVPCSGLGIIRRKPDIKWTRKPEDFAELNKLQERILKNASMYLKPGGILVYSTCTIEFSENNAIIQNFINNNKDFELVALSNLPGKIKLYAKNNKFLQLYPSLHSVDGFFIAKIMKK